MTRSAAGGSPGLALALITDGPQAPEVARRAADLATDQGEVLVLVAVPAIGWSTDASLIAAAQRRRQRDAAAVAGRVAPALDASGVRWRWQSICAGSRPSDRRLARLARQVDATHLLRSDDVNHDAACAAPTPELSAR